MIKPRLLFLETKRRNFMKNGFFIVGFLFLAVYIFGDIPTIVVSNFGVRGSNFTTNDGESITDLFIAEIVKGGKLRVADRASLQKVMAELKFQLSDWADSNQTARLGEALNASYLIQGQLNQLGPKVSLVVTALEINTLEVVSSSSRSWNYTEFYNKIFAEIPTMSNEAANKILVKITEKEIIGRTFRIGDKGPGGGIVFFVKDGSHLECSPTLGTGNISTANRILQTYDLGGYTDWRLPTKDELDLVYQNLKKRGMGNFMDKQYWSSTYEGSHGYSDVPHNWNQDFRNGIMDHDYIYYDGNYRDISFFAVRSF
jgi:TolB-like protein